MIGPQHKNLGEDFLRAFIQHICELDLNHNDPDTEERSFDCRFLYDFDSKKYYEKLLQRKPQFSFDEEDFYVNIIQISNVPFYDDLKNLNSYKSIWNECEKYEPVPYPCPCMDSASSSEDDDDINFHFLPLNVLTTQITFQGEYLSQPLNHTSISGGQYSWDMKFVYQQGDLNLYIDLGPPPRRIHRKYISGHTGPCLETPIIEEQHDVEVTNYIPANMWFDEDFLLILKTTLQLDEHLIKSRGVQYELIDTKFCDTDRCDLGCGCCYSACKVQDKAWGIANLPIKTSYRHDLHCSCTPEWYLQLQIGMCNDYNFTGRFILKYL